MSNVVVRCKYCGKNIKVKLNDDKDIFLKQEIHLRNSLKCNILYEREKLN